MPVTSVDKDPEALTMRVQADFTADLDRLWDAYADPRQIEKFWGPPEWPATFTRHDMAVGGRSDYAMHGPDGTIAAGYFEFLAVDAPHSFEVRDGFAKPDGEVDSAMPSMRMTFEFSATDEGSRLVTTTYFDSVEDMNQLITMGMEEGSLAAMGQIDDVLADLASFAASLATQAQVLSDTQVRISRVIRGTVQQVWDAHHLPELVQRWMLGPDGWSMPVCEVAQRVGDSYRYEWQEDGTDERFGFVGELIEADPPFRSVTTERLLGTDGPSTRNELTLTAVDGGTLTTLVITYPDAELRDTVLATGMVEGMEFGYARLESDVLTG